MGKRMMGLARRALAKVAPDAWEQERRRRWEAWRERWLGISARWSALADQALALMPEGEREHDPGGKAFAPLRRWHRELKDGWSALPVGLTPETMLALLRSLTSGRVDSLPDVCADCGLSRPQQKVRHHNEWKLLPGKAWQSPWPRFEHDLTEFFPRGCPHCSGRDTLPATHPAHLGRDLPWMNDPAAYAGAEPSCHAA
jgi:hypothetical protein